MRTIKKVILYIIFIIISLIWSPLEALYMLLTRSISYIAVLLIIIKEQIEEL